ncbi:unnamed protein product [Arctogadus glacialis]
MRFVRVSVCRAASFRTTDSSAAQRWRTIHSRRHIPPSRDASLRLLVVVVLGKAAPWTTAPCGSVAVRRLLVFGQKFTCWTRLAHRCSQSDSDAPSALCIERSIQPLHLQPSPSHPTALVGGWWCLIPAFRLLAEAPCGGAEDGRQSCGPSALTIITPSLASLSPVRLAHHLHSVWNPGAPSTYGGGDHC